MDRIPTAEEVLELYLAINVPANSHPNYDDWIKAKEKAANDFIRAVKQWKNAKGPVTREWFCKRFGGDIFHGEKGSLYFFPDSIDLEIEDRSVDLYGLTRSDIETFVRALGNQT